MFLPWLALQGLALDYHNSGAFRTGLGPFLLTTPLPQRSPVWMMFVFVFLQWDSLELLGTILQNHI